MLQVQVKMVAETVARVVGKPEDSSGFDRIAHLDIQLLQMGIDGLVTIFVAYPNVNSKIVPLALQVNRVIDHLDRTGRNGEDFRAPISPDVNALVPTVVAVKLPVILRIGAKVLGDDLELGRPDLKPELRRLARFGSFLLPDWLGVDS